MESGRMLLISNVAFTNGASSCVSQEGFSKSFLQEENRRPIRKNDRISFFIVKLVFTDFTSVKDKEFIRKIKS
jgi:hypothetical protein